MDELADLLKSIRETQQEMLSLILGLPGNIAPDVIHLLREGLEDIDCDLDEADLLVEGYQDAADEGCDCDCGPDDDLTPLQHAEALCDWARGEDPRNVGRALEAIGGGMFQTSP